MFCKSCGKELSDNTTVCPFCKTATNTHKQKNKRSIITFIVVTAILIILVTVITYIIIPKQI